MIKDETLVKLEGLHTIESAAEALGIKKSSALNLLSRLKKQGHATRTGGGKQKRIYRITARKQNPRSNGMFDIINKHSPMKLSPWYDHQVHGKYGPEEALIDAIQTRSFRVILASLRLYNHITDWPKLYRLAKEKNIWQKVGALYDVARMHFRVRKMPRKYAEKTAGKKHYLIEDYPTKEPKYINIANKWNIELPFREGDLKKAET